MVMSPRPSGGFADRLPKTLYPPRLLVWETSKQPQCIFCTEPMLVSSIGQTEYLSNETLHVDACHSDYKEAECQV